MSEKIVVLQPCGFTGKTVVVASLLLPRLRDRIEVLSIAWHEEDAARFGIDVVRFLGSEFAASMQRLASAAGSVIVDVASSEFHHFVEGLFAHPGSLSDWDLVIIPVTPQPRVQRAAINLIDLLSAMGLRQEQLKILFNRVITGSGNATVEQRVQCQFCGFLAQAAVRGIPVALDAALPEAAIHGDLAASQLSICEILTDATDFTSLTRIAVAERRPESEIRYLARRLYLKRAAQGAVAELDAAFSALRIPVTGSGS
jgi:hypothetical protein